MKVLGLSFYPKQTIFGKEMKSGYYVELIEKEGAAVIVSPDPKEVLVKEAVEESEEIFSKLQNILMAKYCRIFSLLEEKKYNEVKKIFDKEINYDH